MMDINYIFFLIIKYGILMLFPNFLLVGLILSPVEHLINKEEITTEDWDNMLIAIIPIFIIIGINIAIVY